MRKRKGKKRERKGGEGGKLLDPCPPFRATICFSLFSSTSPSSLNLKLHTNGNWEKKRGAKETSDDGTG